jgi:hypothetical protein
MSKLEIARLKLETAKLDKEAAEIRLETARIDNRTAQREAEPVPPFPTVGYPPEAGVVHYGPPDQAGSRLDGVVHYGGLPDVVKDIQANKASWQEARLQASDAAWQAVKDFRNRRALPEGPDCG